MKCFFTTKWGTVIIIAACFGLGAIFGSISLDSSPNPTEPTVGNNVATQTLTTAPAATQGQTEESVVFVYDGDASDLDTSNLVENCLYLLDGDIISKLTEPILQYHVSESRIDYVYKWESNRVYYVLESEPTKVYCMDLLNETQSMVYESQNGDVMFVDWYSEEPHDKLILIEDSKRVIILDLLTNETELLMEQYYVWQVTYTPDSLYYGEEDKGPTLYWAGKTSEDDTHERGYVYHILTGENWKATWK